jgi:hypothetical protein
MTAKRNGTALENHTRTSTPPEKAMMGLIQTLYGLGKITTAINSLGK